MIGRHRKELQEGVCLVRSTSVSVVISASPHHYRHHERSTCISDPQSGNAHLRRGKGRGREKQDKRGVVGLGYGGYAGLGNAVVGSGYAGYGQGYIGGATYSAGYGIAAAPAATYGYSAPIVSHGYGAPIAPAIVSHGYSAPLYSSSYRVGYAGGLGYGGSSLAGYGGLGYGYGAGLGYRRGLAASYAGNGW
ncbi:shematrin-like protein 2 [Pogonomyrmex barbatus]|uniref:Shematrin-like protein 2 n=1 Tax=Pogonomyrmex barbatus TaxID=144034 RepID=A0A6I9WI08_9HYME|nr:shematrin-like protein 2 [Pogonomyrmex barbatus]